MLEGLNRSRNMADEDAAKAEKIRMEPTPLTSCGFTIVEWMLLQACCVQTVVPTTIHPIYLNK